MEAIVLAGGFGTRLQSVVNDVPKPMAPIKGRPFLCYVLDYLCGQGIKKCILAVGYKYEKIKAYFGDSYQGLELIYSIEGEPLGTGGAIKQACEYCSDSDIFVFNGDTYFEVDLQALRTCYNDKFAMACLYKEDAARYGLIRLQNNLVTELVEKRPDSCGLINGGVYLLNKNVFELCEGKFSLEIDILPTLVKQGSVNAIVSDGYFIDIGIPEDYKRAEKEL